ncbi:MAG: hypothetical protein WA324_19910 [Bryobacteraceae bacterium]
MSDQLILTPQERAVIEKMRDQEATRQVAAVNNNRPIDIDEIGANMTPERRAQAYAEIRAIAQREGWG